MDLQIDIDARQALRALDRATEWPFEGTMQSLGECLADEALANILDRKTDQSTGLAFAPWSPNYRAPKHAGHSLLFLTGDMARSIDVEAQRDEARVGASSPAQYHVHGRGRMHRDFLSAGPEQEQRLLEMAAAELENELRGGA